MADDTLPVAVSDAAAVTLGGVQQANGNVLANDHDSGGGALTVATVDGQSANVGTAIQGLYGSLALGADGQYQYVLNNNLAIVQALAPGQTVTDVFTYTISDGSPHTVTTTFTNENLITQSEAFNSSVWVPFAYSGAAPAVTANVAAGPQGGASTADQVALSGVDRGLYYVSDVQGQYTFNLWVKLVSGSGAFSLSYYDGATDSAHVQSFSANSTWQQVSVTFNGSGNQYSNVAFLHGDTQTGSDVFQIWGAQLNPGSTASAYLPTTGAIAETTTTTTAPVVVGSELDVTVTGAPIPVAVSDAAAVTLGGVQQANGNVLANDHDSGGGALTVATVDGQSANVGTAIQGLYGSLALGADGQYQYVLNNNLAIVQALAPGQTVTDVFTYTISDGSPHTVTTTFTNENLITQSEAFNSSVWVPFAYSGAAPAVTANVAAGPQGGASTADQVALSGVDRGLYYVSDVQGQYTFNLWVKLVSGSGAFSLSYYDGATDSAHVQSFSANSTWQQVSVTFNGSGNQYSNVAFLHGDTQTGSDVFQIWGAQLNPGSTASAYLPTTGAIAETTTTTTAPVVVGSELDVTVTGAPIPVAVSDAAAVTLGGVQQANGNVLANDHDSGGGALTVATVDGQSANVGTAIQGLYGSLALGADGQYQYVLNNNLAIVQALAPGQTVTDVFTYTISDGSPHTVTTTFTNENLITQSEAFNSSVWVPFAYSGAAPAVTANVAAGPQGGASTADQVALSGVDRGLYYVSDVQGQYTFNLWVKLVSGSGAFSLSYYDGATDSAHVQSFSANSTWQQVSVTFNGSGNQYSNVAFLHGDTQTGSDVFQIWGAQLNPGSTASAYLPTTGAIAETTTTTTAPVVVGSELDVTVTGAPIPVAVSDAAAVTLGGVQQANGNVLANDHDSGGGALTVATVDGQSANVGTAIQGLYGSLALGADGQYQYVLNNNLAIVQALAPGQTVTDVFTYTISDGSPHTVTTTFTNENLITQSEAFNSSVWVPFAYSGAAPAVTANVAAGPQGGASTADQVALSGVDRGLYYVSDVQGQYTFNLWVKLVSGSGAFSLSYYDGATDSAHVQSFSANSTWQQVSVTFNGSGNQYSNVAFLHGDTQTGSDVFQIWGAQLNPGSTASAYLPTTGAIAETTTTTTAPVVVGSELDVTVTGGAKPLAPAALGDAATVSLTATHASGDVLTNDQDPGALPLNVVAVNGEAANVGSSIQGQYGALMLGANGQYEYVLATGQPNVQALAPGQIATDVFSYTISDGTIYPSTAASITGENLFLWSEAFDNPAWVKFGSPLPTVTANVATGPLGGAATADQVSLPGGADGIYYVTDAAGEYTFSVWVKLVSGDGHIDLNYYDGVNGHLQNFVATSSWQRLSITFTGSGSGNGNVALMHDTGETNTGVFQVFGAQLNPGPSMGDYVPTTGHIDSVFVPASGPQVINGQLTVSVEGPDPAAGGAGALNFAGGTQGVVVDLQSGQWSHALKVLALGDSITYGWTAIDYQQGQTNTEDGYRGPLWWDFARQNAMINFVGPNDSGDALLPDQSHAGFPGERSDEIDARLPAILAASQPDAILLMAGSNDIFQEVDPALHVAANLSAMITTAASASAATHIYVATLMPINQADDAEPGDAAMIATVNKAIVATVTEAAASGLNVSLVDTSSITVSDLQDAVHPTSAAYSKLADIWYQTMLTQQPVNAGTPGGVAHAISAGVTTVTGTEDNDLLIASNLGSVLNGGGGNDRLVAGHGADTLTGGSGADEFVFARGDGHATIADFSQSQADHIELDGFSGLTQFSQLSGSITVSAGSTVINLSAFGAPTSITLSHFTGALSASDFWFN